MYHTRCRGFAQRIVTTAVGFIIAGCAFQPHVEPLQVPTVPPQAFSGTVGPGEPTIPPPTPDVPSPGEAGFDPDDPLAWIAAIEERWPNVDVVVCGASSLLRAVFLGRRKRWSCSTTLSGTTYSLTISTAKSGLYGTRGRNGMD